MAYHGRGVGVAGTRLPLSHHLARLAGNRAIHASSAWLIRTHGKTGVLGTGDVVKVAIIGKGAAGALLNCGARRGKGGEGARPRVVNMDVSSVGMVVAVGGGGFGREQHKGCRYTDEPHCEAEGVLVSKIM